MPTFEAFTRDVRKWENCRRIVAEQMIAAGWNKHAGKFGEVQRRKAEKLYAKTP